MDIMEIRKMIEEQTRNGRTSVYINTQDLVHLGISLNGALIESIYVDAQDLEHYLDAVESGETLLTHNWLMKSKDSDEYNIKIIK